MPMRGPVTIAGTSVRAMSSNGAASSGRPSCSRVIASAWHSFPGPEHNARSASTPRRACIVSIPCVGASARMSTASARPGSAHTKFTHQWIPYERYTYAWPGGPNIDAFRSVGPRNPWLAGSSWSYASTSTIWPPTPSTSSVTPIRSGATSCADRAKKLRASRGVISKEDGEKCRHDDRGHDAADAAGHDREAQARQLRDDARLEVPERRRARDLCELDAAEPSAHVVGRDRENDGRPEDRAHLVGRAGDTEQQEREPQRVREAECGDGGAPAADGEDDRATLTPHAHRPSGEERHEERTDSRRGEQVADRRRVAEHVLGKRREERPGHAEDHRERVDEEERENEMLQAQVAEAIGDRRQRHLRRVLVRRDGRQPHDGDERDEDSCERHPVRRGESDRGDEDAGDRGADDEAEVVVQAVQRGCGRQLLERDEPCGQRSDRPCSE